jgi:hypothetical protein
MQSPEPDTGPPAPPRAARAIAGAFPWHLRGFLAVNGVLQLANFVSGRPWWAFWPLAATGLLLAVHYLLYKALAADQRWVDERIQELNLKSYDRSHIEDLKARHGGESEGRGS